MSLAIFLVSALIGVFFLWEGRKARDAEVRSRALYAGRFFSSLVSDDIAAENRNEIKRKITTAFLAQEDLFRENGLVYLITYGKNGQLILGKTPAGFLAPGKTTDHQHGTRTGVREQGLATLDSLPDRGPVVRQTVEGVYDLTMPVTAGAVNVGYVRLGLSGQDVQKRFLSFVTKAAAAVFGIFLLGLAFSRILAANFLRPVARLSAAVEELGRRNWKTPIPVSGRDELSSLADAFNQMASALKQRETSLSRGNRDLFILHTAELDLMEGLDLQSLLAKIAARAEDLVKADTTAVAVVDRSDRVLKYLGVFGSKARALRELDVPLEAGGIYNWLASYGTPLLVQDAQADFRLDSGAMKQLAVKSLLAVPLWTSNTMMGIITAVNKKGGETFDRHDLRLFTVFSNLAGAALQNSFLYHDLKQKMEELRSTQQQLVHTSKMAAIGELAANIAHEINNPLTSVLGYASHLLKSLDVPEQSRQKLRMMEQETLRVRKIIRNLLDFSRQRTSWIRPGDLAQPLKETVALLQGVAEAASVRIREEYPPSPVIVNMDQNEIKQVFINIMNNALQAMPNGGELRIRIDASRDQEAVVEFSDTGKGIAAENLPKIFEPFFSTKGNGDGTGLGLSISYRIIQGHGGRIEVESEVGRGSAFRVVLPPCEKDAAADQRGRERGGGR
jgi:signal transduction histidine kinase